MAIKISKALYAQMIDHAKKCYPQESCGLLSGKNSQADRFYTVRNMEQSSVSYLMDPKEQMRVFKMIQDDKSELLGIFHSHVASSAQPSQKDKLMAPFPDVSYLIVSLANMDEPDLKAFKIEEGQVEELEIQVQ